MVGQVIVSVWRDNVRCKMGCKVVDNESIRPILGRKACAGVRIIKYIDNDELNIPETGNAPVYSVESNKQPVNKETLLLKQRSRSFQ